MHSPTLSTLPYTYLQYRAEMLFKVIVVDGPLGKVKYHAIRVEFQVRGSPHVHSFLWITDAPGLSKDNANEYTQFIMLFLKHVHLMRMKIQNCSI